MNALSRFLHNFNCLTFNYKTKAIDKAVSYFISGSKVPFVCRFVFHRFYEYDKIVCATIGLPVVKNVYSGVTLLETICVF